MNTDLILRQPLDLERHPGAVYLARLASGSRRTMRTALNTIAQLLTPGGDAASVDWSRVRYQHVAAVRAALADRYAPANVNKHLSALRGVLKEAWRLGQVSAEDYHRAVDFEGIRGETLPAGRALAQDELSRLFAACRQDAGLAGKRDAAVLAVLYAAGLRRSEVASLRRQDYDAAAGCLTIRRAKGKKDRTVYIANGFKAALDAWVAARGSEEGSLFCRILQVGRLTMAGLSGQAVYNILARRQEEAGIEDCSPHDLRRTYISDLLDLGADLKATADSAGHANVQTTARYDRRGDRAKQAVAALLEMPV